MVRSAAADEDTTTGSGAGKYLSLLVRGPAEWPEALARVIAALPEGEGGGLVFVQPFVAASWAGVAVTDGFHYEDARAEGSNFDLTSGRAPGLARRGSFERDDPWHAWLAKVHRVFGGTIDIEWAILEGTDDPARAVLLQARPALFPLRRNPRISLANHKEILGDPPSPWMAGLLMAVSGPVMDQYRKADAAVASWDEPYAIELAGRAWLNLSGFFRLMDHWGFPRALVTESFGGSTECPADRRVRIGAFLKTMPAKLRFSAGNRAVLKGLDAAFERLDRDLAAATSLPDLWQVNVAALDLALRVNFAINSPLALISKLRRMVGLQAAAKVVTRDLMDEYAALAREPDRVTRREGLDAWLARHGHRGPIESDPWQPRFSELRDRLATDLEAPAASRPSSTMSKKGPAQMHAPPAWARPLFRLDEKREAFRDRLMRWWSGLRAKLLLAAEQAVSDGWLDRVEDASFLRGETLRMAPSSWRASVAVARTSWAEAPALAPLTTTDRDAVIALMASTGPAPIHDGDAAAIHQFQGIGLGTEAVEGRVVRADHLLDLLGRTDLPADAVLVAPTLEPAWAVVFHRLRGVVTDLGGALSHASILLREANVTAIVNARGACLALRDGDRVRLDPDRGVVFRQRPDQDEIGPSEPGETF
jgi:pyruvate,water dikinase